LIELPHVVVPFRNKGYAGNFNREKVEWSKNEKILVEWGDIAACNKWLHTESCKLFTRRNAYFIPIIVISTITGALSFIASGFDRRQTSSITVGVGSANIIIGMSTIHQFLNVAG
jgi:hypothetical protein